MTQTLTEGAWRHTGEVTWGDALVLRVHHSRIGLNPYVAVIHAVMGRDIGSRSTFAKLQDVADPSTLDRRWAYRAWLLLAVMGEEPVEWGIDDDAVPRGVDRGHLLRSLKAEVRHQGLEPRTRWFEVSGNFLAPEAELVA